MKPIGNAARLRQRGDDEPFNEKAWNLELVPGFANLLEANQA
jgi:hypothetical protein